MKVIRAERNLHCERCGHEVSLISFYLEARAKVLGPKKGEFYPSFYVHLCQACLGEALEALKKGEPKP